MIRDYIKGSNQVLCKPVNNLLSWKEMIITLLPLFLAAKIDPQAQVWKNGAEVTYLIQNHATINYPVESNGIDRSFDLNGKMSCQQIWDTNKLTCSFHDIKVHSSLIDTKSPKLMIDFIRDDLWIRKTLQHDSFSILFDEKGISEIMINEDVDPDIRGMIAVLANSLNVGLKFSEKIEGDFEAKANVSNALCKTLFFVTRSSNVQKSSNINLFLIRQPNETLSRVIEISRKIEDKNCSYRRYSAFIYRDIRKLKPEDFEATVDSAENFMTISESNFTSFSKATIQMTNFKENTKYVIHESTTLSLKDISPIRCTEEDSHFARGACFEEDIIKS